MICIHLQKVGDYSDVVCPVINIIIIIIIINLLVLL